MKHYDKVTPDGTRDLLFDECVSREEVVSRLTAMFRSRGYRQVITPAIEFTTCSAPRGAFPAGEHV